MCAGIISISSVMRDVSILASFLEDSLLRLRLPSFIQEFCNHIVFDWALNRFETCYYCAIKISHTRLGLAILSYLIYFMLGLGLQQSSNYNASSLVSIMQ